MKIKKFNLNYYAVIVAITSFLIAYILSPKYTYNFSKMGDYKSIEKIFLDIFSHNYVIFIIFLLSFVFGKWVIMINLTLNMVQIGWVLGSSNNALLTFLMLLPHGVLEIAAILLMANLCWKGPEWFLKNKKAFLKYFLISNILLFVAAVVESIYIFGVR